MKPISGHSQACKDSRIVKSWKLSLTNSESQLKGHLNQGQKWKSHRKSKRNGKPSIHNSM